MLGFGGRKKKHKVERAARLAADELLDQAFSYSTVKTHASKLCLNEKQSPEMLAAQTALWFFRNPGEKFEALLKSQLSARKMVLKWYEEGRLPSMLLTAFESSLHKKYHPNNLGKTNASEQAQETS
ncbi:hypothetical protein [Ruegeria arenilitoris]|uniref:hypothetical protein n=1 Tax=Ruegeria arenilitoris TaxID=1173585 RepID=UPI001C2BD35C|nr:hypothetical protein [Ruegeria arenilitoris]